MNPQLWRRVEEIFSKAIEIATAEEREAFVACACGADDELRSEVNKLLADDEHAHQNDFLSPLSINLKNQLGDEPQDSLLNCQLGSFEIKRLIGKGGMGNVYLAVRTTEFKQCVAVKVLKRGMDTDEILRRFRTEIQVLATLSKHANIAGLIDAGTTSDGLPYFVMEYVEGETMNRFCDNRRLSVRDRLRLFCSVCAAVQFAHQHAVIHRDLKMSNILVTIDGIPKLIDFGIAKLTVPGLGGQTVLPTATQQRFLTPEYASPEQLRGDSLTTSSDVYSLGVILFELLTGSRPYQSTSLSSEQFERAIQELEAEKPSTAVSQTVHVRGTVGDARERNAESVSKARHTSPNQLARTLRGDLDNIVLKALRKEPQRRYGSAARLAEDIERFLSGQPVQARSPTQIESLARWCKAHPIPLVLFIAMVLGLSLGIFHLSNLTEYLVQTSAEESAAQQARVLTEVQDFYSRAVVRDLDNPALPFDHPYQKQPGRIPVPATFTKELAKTITDKSPAGMAARLYSDRPFPPQQIGSEFNSGRLDEFEKHALRELRKNPDQPVRRFEVYKGRLSLRFAVARVLKQDCLKCHNNENNKFPDAPPPAQSSEAKWKAGDVRGVLEIIRPLDKDYERIRAGLRTTFLLVIGKSAGLILLAVLIVMIKKRQRRRLRSVT